MTSPWIENAHASGKQVLYLEKVQKEEVKHASWMDRFFKK